SHANEFDQFAVLESRAGRPRAARQAFWGETIPMNALITLAHRVLSSPPRAAAAKWISGIAAFSLLAGAPSLQAQEKLFDYGDAPQVYPVMFGQNGARHGVGELRLGTRLDWEQDGQPSSGANADDSLPVGSADDEDGVVFGNALVP